MLNEVKFGAELRDEFVKGVDLIANAVKTTMGPGGRTCIYRNRMAEPVPTKDGVTVAKQVKTDESYQAIAIELLREVGRNTVEIAGDGTTTAMVLAQAFTHSLIDCGATNIIKATRGAQAALKDTLLDLQSASTETTPELLQQVAYVASNADSEIAELSYEIAERLGEDGEFTLSLNAGDPEDSFIQHEGLFIKRGFESNYDITDEARRLVVNETGAAVLLCDVRFTKENIRPVLDVALAIDIQLVAFGVDWDKQATAMIEAYNSNPRTKNRIVMMRCPGYGLRRIEQTQDVAVYLDGKLISTSMWDGLVAEKDAAQHLIQSLGHTTGYRLSVRDSVFKADVDSAVLETRMDVIRNQLKGKLTDYERGVIEKRLAQLAGKLIEVYVGGYTSSSAKERLDRFDDAIKAVLSAKRHGVVLGGGQFLMRHCELSNRMGTVGGDIDFACGYNAFLDALGAPFNTILTNAGVGQQELDQIKQVCLGGMVYDANSLTHVNDEDNLVYDSVCVLQAALTNALDIAITITTCGVGIINDTVTN